MIQPEGPGTTVTCPSCSHADVYPGDAKAEVITCDQCRARIAYGHLMPRWVNEPATDPRFIKIKVGDFVLTLDREFARTIALDILSVCPAPVRPIMHPAYGGERDLQAILTSPDPFPLDVPPLAQGPDHG
jgi:hypothetical protein